MFHIKEFKEYIIESASISTIVKIPFINKKFFKNKEINDYYDIMKDIIKKYKIYVEPISKITSVHPGLIYAMLFVESKGNPNSTNGNYLGLMQISITSAGDAITYSKKKGLLTEQCKTAIKKFISQKQLDMYLNRDNLSIKPEQSLSIKKNDLLKPEFNILCGSIYLGNLLNKYKKEQNETKLAKIIYGYNVGFFSKIQGTTVEQIYNNSPEETKNYILQVNGINGALSFLKTLL